MIGVDISGRHEDDGEYLMVAAAVQAEIDTTRIRSVHGVGFARSRSSPTLQATIQVVAKAVGNLPDAPVGPIVSERGEFYEEPAEVVGFEFQPEFKYVESIGERETVQVAHHAAYAARTLLK